MSACDSGLATFRWFELLDGDGASSGQVSLGLVIGKASPARITTRITGSTFVCASLSLFGFGLVLVL